MVRRADVARRKRVDSSTLMFWNAETEKLFNSTETPTLLTTPEFLQLNLDSMPSSFPLSISTRFGTRFATRFV